MSNIEIEIRDLVKKLVQDHLPESKITLTVLGWYTPLKLPYAGVIAGKEIGISDESVFELLKKKGVLILHEQIPPSNKYSPRPPKYIVSYSQSLAEEFLDTIRTGDFSLRLSTGLAKYEDNEATFKSDTIFYNLYKNFIENPRIKFTYEQLNKIISTKADYDNKELQDIIKKLKSRLKIPPGHFQANYGYTFLP